MQIADYMDNLRREKGLLTIAEVVALSQRGNVIFDPYSALISRLARIGKDNVFYPGVSLFCSEAGSLVLGDCNILHASTLIEASLGGVSIGAGNQFGEGGFTLRANRPGAIVTIGDEGRYMNGASVFGETFLGSGSQILGAIAVDNCRLEGGGSYRSLDPDARAGLLKGFGAARGLVVPQGHVIVGAGIFLASAQEPQSVYHPRS